MQKMELRNCHIIVDLYGCPEEKLQKADVVLKLLNEVEEQIIKIEGMQPEDEGLEHVNIVKQTDETTTSLNQ